MTGKRQVRPALPARVTTDEQQPGDFAIRDSDINLINEKLGQARATIDLILTITYDTSGVLLESLSSRENSTLSDALMAAVQRIDEAILEANRPYAERAELRFGRAQRNGGAA
jgi:hypothetical protein